MTERESNLPVPFDISAQLERLKTSGLIEGSVGDVERSMDSLLQTHLTEIALLQARGDTAPERPFYIFNPDSGLLINFAYRRDEDPTKTGLFADVVELDEDGMPRYGVSVVNPFANQRGFINVTIGENTYGFTPSYTDRKFDSDDPLSAVPPNVATANLLAMLGQNAISESETLDDFVKRRQAERDVFQAKVIDYQKRSFPGTVQSVTEYTNPDLHLIISDREDPSEIAQASRNVGLFPIIVTGDDVLRHLEDSTTAISPTRELVPEEYGRYLFKLLHNTVPDLHDWLKGNEPAFLTIDLPRTAIRDGEGNERFVTLRTVKTDFVFDETTQRDKSVNAREGKPVTRPRSDTLDMFIRDMVRQSPVFARIENDRFREGSDGYIEDGMVIKIGHGLYHHIPVDENPKNLLEYTDWLRKVKLDLAMTMYLRGLNQL